VRAFGAGLLVVTFGAGIVAACGASSLQGHSGVTRSKAELTTVTTQAQTFTLKCFSGGSGTSANSYRFGECDSVGALPVPVTRTCASPRGPGDRLLHSRSLRVFGITCSVGRDVALACTRFTYGRSGSCAVAGYAWRCISSKGSGLRSAQLCTAGRRLMQIVWTD